MEQNRLVAIKNLNDQQLIANTNKLVREERRITLEVLLHLREIEIRRLFVDLGLDSMHAYCLKRLKYSEGKAQRRLAAARLLRELPEIETQIKNGDLFVTNLSAVQSFVRAEKMADKPLTREEKLELVATVENKSTRKVKAELIWHSHQPALLADKFQMSTTAILGIQFAKFEASMTEENLALLQEFKNLYAHDLPDLSSHSTLMFLLQKAVQHKKKRLGLISENSGEVGKSLLQKSRHEKPNAILPSAADVNVARDKALTKIEKSLDSRNIKTEKIRAPISIKTQRQIWQRANACCEHVDTKTKTRCLSKFALEMDHINPLAIGGSNELKNLRLLCRAHNSRRALKTFGMWTSNDERRAGEASSDGQKNIPEWAR